MALTMSGIEKAFNRNKVLKNVSFSLEKGEIHALIGENGAGKSTLMNILGGVLRPDAGEIALDGKPLVFSSPRDSMNAGNRHYHREREQQGHELLHGSDLLFLNYYSAPWGAAIIESITHPPRRASTGACRWADRARCGIPRASFRPAF